jgi:hypothetical protein
VPKDHARKSALAEIKSDLGVRHSVAIDILDHPEREAVYAVFEEYDVKTVPEALAVLNAPENQLLCGICGWTNGMVCPECAKGCGCETRCSGWRHSEYGPEDDDPQTQECPGCGADIGEGSYEECFCGDFRDGPEPLPEPDPDDAWRDAKYYDSIPAREEPDHYEVTADGFVVAGGDGDEG